MFPNRTPLHTYCTSTPTHALGAPPPPVLRLVGGTCLSPLCFAGVWPPCLPWSTFCRMPSHVYFLYSQSLFFLCHRTIWENCYRLTDHPTDSLTEQTVYWCLFFSWEIEMLRTFSPLMTEMLRSIHIGRENSLGNTFLPCCWKWQGEMEEVQYMLCQLHATTQNKEKGDGGGGKWMQKVKSCSVIWDLSQPDSCCCCARVDVALCSGVNFCSRCWLDLSFRVACAAWMAVNPFQTQRGFNIFTLPFTYF